MCRTLALCLCMLLFSGVIATAQDATEDEQAATAADVSDDEQAAADMTDGEHMAAVHDVGEDAESGAKEMSGMSIVGNDEAPKSLYIVPWESSEIGVETSLDMMLNENAVPVDREVFKRQLDFYQISARK